MSPDGRQCEEVNGRELPRWLPAVVDQLQRMELAAFLEEQELERGVRITAAERRGFDDQIRPALVGARRRRVDAELDGRTAVPPSSDGGAAYLLAECVESSVVRRQHEAKDRRFAVAQGPRELRWRHRQRFAQRPRNVTRRARICP